MKDLIVNFVPTGMVPTKEKTPHVPVSVTEIVEDVLMAAELGAAIVHLHARDEKAGLPTSDFAIWEAIISSIRRFNREIIICASLSGRNISDPEVRMTPLRCEGEAKPDMASLTTSSLNFAKSASVNSPSTIEVLARRMIEVGVKPELEIFDLGMSNAVRYLAKKGLVKGARYHNVILGNLFGAQATPSHFSILADELAADGLVSFGGIGAAQNKAVIMAITAGHHIRVGLEDNIWLDGSRTRLATNRELVLRAVEFGASQGRSPAPPAKVRELLGLLPGNGSYGVEKEEIVATE